MSSHGGGSSLGQASATSSISDPLMDDHDHDHDGSAGSQAEGEDPSIGAPSTITSERESLLSVRSGSADDVSSSALSRRSSRSSGSGSRSSGSRSSRTASSISDRLDSLHASQESLGASQSSLLKRLGIRRDEHGNMATTTSAAAAGTGTGTTPTTPPDAHSFAPVSSAVVQDSAGMAISTAPPAQGGGGGGAASTSTAGGASFGGGRGWEGWDREEGHRALGQSYQRHAMVLREADAGSVHTDTDPNNPYDVDEFGSVSMGGSRNSSRGGGHGTGGSSSGSHSKITSSGGSGSDSRSSHVQAKHSTSSGKSTATSGSRSTSDPTRIFGKLIRPSREGLAAQTIMAKRRHSLRTMGRENFLSSMEQGDHLEKRRMASAAGGAGGSKLGGYGLDDYDYDGRPSKFPRLSTMKMVCASVAVVSALTCGVILLALPQSGPATAMKDAYTTSEETVRSIVFRSRSEAAASIGGVTVDVPSVVENSSSNTGQREIEDVQEAAAVPVEEVEDIPEPTTATTETQDATRTLNMLVPLTEYNTAHSIDEEGIYIPESSSDHYANIWDEFLPTDVPLYWDGQFSGGCAASGILARCFDMSLAATKAEMENIQYTTAVEGHHLLFDEIKYMMFSPNKINGIDTIADGHGDGHANVLLTEQFHGVSDLFDPDHRGRVFSILQHPFARELSKYKHLVAANAISENMTFLDWTKSGEGKTPFERHNNLVRVLTNEPMKPLTPEHIDAAKEVVRRKLIVGFMDNFDESFRRFARYLGWSLGEERMDCMRHWRRIAKQVLPGDAEAEVLVHTQWADLELYEYALSIFEEQTVLIEDSQALRTEMA